MLETLCSLNSFIADAKQGMSMFVSGSKNDGSIAHAAWVPALVWRGIGRSAQVCSS